MKGCDEMDKITALRIFDDYCFIGNENVGFHVLQTKDGLVLFDTMDLENADEEYLIPGLKILGLEKLTVAAVFLTHGHFDHYMGAEHVRMRTGCQVYLSREDCVFMVTSLDNREKGNMPHITGNPEDGQVLQFGDHDVSVIFAPGHTPGCLNYSFPVHEKGKKHRAVLIGGGGVFGPGRYPGKEEYPHSAVYAADQALSFASSILKTWDYVQKTGCDVYLTAHPFACDLLEKAARNKEGEENHLIIGTEQVGLSLKKQYKICVDSATVFVPLP